MTGSKTPARRPMREDGPDVTDRLEFLAGRQRINDGRTQNCPRCGQPSIKPRLHTNALSRYAKIYICDLCGNREGALAMQGRRLPFSEWAAARPYFRVEPAEDVRNEDPSPHVDDG